MACASSAQTGAAPRGVCGRAGYKCVLSLGENSARKLQGPQHLQEFRRKSSATTSVLPEQHLGSLSAVLDFALSSFESLFGHIPVQSLEIWFPNE